MNKKTVEISISEAGIPEWVLETPRLFLSEIKKGLEITMRRDGDSLFLTLEDPEGDGDQARYDSYLRRVEKRRGAEIRDHLLDNIKAVRWE